MMIEPGWKVYQGMIVGQHTRDNDLEVNVLKGKKLTNIRTHSKDEAVRLTPPIQMTLEKALAYIQDDELVEVTPKSIRLRKALLDPHDRKRAERAKSAAATERGGVGRRDWRTCRGGAALFRQSHDFNGLRGGLVPQRGAGRACARAASRLGEDCAERQRICDAANQIWRGGSAQIADGLTVRKLDGPHLQTAK